jgi:hypothetical protein
MYLPSARANHLHITMALQLYIVCAVLSWSLKACINQIKGNALTGRPMWNSLFYLHHSCTRSQSAVNIQTLTFERFIYRYGFSMAWYVGSLYLLHPLLPPCVLHKHEVQCIIDEPVAAFYSLLCAYVRACVCARASVCPCSLKGGCSVFDNMQLCV